MVILLAEMKKWKMYKHKNKGKYEDKRNLNPKPVGSFFFFKPKFSSQKPIFT
jgi:hypothetical protein